MFRSQEVKKTKKAFGIIEVLIACAVLIMITGALLTINLIITRDVALVRGRAQAYNLASGGIEAVREIRDSNLIDGSPKTSWNSFVCRGSNFEAPNTSSKYSIELRGDGCDGSTPKPRLMLVGNDNGEDIVIGGATYNRKISFRSSGISPTVDGSTSVTEDNAIRVDVTVSWNSNLGSRTVTVSELITNWKQGI